MKSPYGSFRAVVFDLDGTLLDTVPDTHNALNRVFVEDGLRALSLDEVRGLVGEGARTMLRRARDLVGAAMSEDALGQLERRYLAAYLEDPTGHTIIYPGAREVLQELHRAGLALGICTNKPRASTGVVLDALDLAKFFTAVVCPEDVEFRKPDGRHVHATLDGLRARPADAVFIGDSETDIAAAADAGVEAVLVSWGYSHFDVASLSTTAVIDRFADLPPLLRKIGSRGFSV